HVVKAYDELIALRKKIEPNVPMVIHGYNKSEQLGHQLMAQGFSLSFGKAILNGNSGAAAILRASDQFFLETDDSDLHIEDIYRAAANLKNTTVDELKALIFGNWKSANLI
ncbi:MAG: hydrolase TatD, partial [Pedobacter sp.]|nr:hydrolase TatD [Pedobacter sp.]